MNCNDETKKCKEKAERLGGSPNVEVFIEKLNYSDTNRKNKNKKTKIFIASVPHRVSYDKEFIYLKEVEGRSVDIAGLPCFIFREDDGNWNVSELRTGLRVAQGGTQKDAIKLATQLVEKEGLQKSNQHVQSFLSLFSEYDWFNGSLNSIE